MRFTALVVFVALCGFAAAQSRNGRFSGPGAADPILEWHFTLDCIPSTGSTSRVTSYFTHIEGISNQNEWECERFTASNGREVTSCLPSQLVVKPLILKRILTLNDEFWSWRDEVANGQLTSARTDCTITMWARDYTRAFTWEIKNAWPASVELEPLGTMIPGEAPGKKALVEIITMIHEGLAREAHTSYSQALGSILAP